MFWMHVIMKFVCLQNNRFISLILGVIKSLITLYFLDHFIFIE